MDASGQEYQSVVMEAALRIIEGVDCSVSQSSVAGQLQAEIVRLQDAGWVEDQRLCALILRASDSPIAQSYRNIRQIRMTDRRWAGLSFSSDVQAKVLEELQIGRFDHPEIRARVMGWQRRMLRGSFADETPWSVIADWFEDCGDSRRASLCRELDAADQ